MATIRPLILENESFSMRIAHRFTGFRSFAALAAAALAAWSPGHAHAQSETALSEITVTATRAQRPIEQVPTTVRVVERAEIEQQLQFSASPAAALSKLIPGYSASTETISGASESFRGRDLLVMIDGVPMNTPLRDVSRILSMIDMNAVERIEVASGASSLYGAGATGGTVNFITRRPAEGKPQVTVSTAVRAFTANVGGSLAPETSVSIMGARNGFDYTIIGTGRMAGRTYDGAGRELPSDAMLGQGGGDRYWSGNLFSRFGYTFENGRRFEVSAMVIGLEQNPQYNTLYSGTYARPNTDSLYTGRSVTEKTSSFQARYTDANFSLGSLSLQAFYNDTNKRFNYSDYSYPYNSLVYYSGNPNSPTSPYNQTVLHSRRYGLNGTVDTPLDMVRQGARLTWGADVSRDNTSQELTDGREVFTPLAQTSLAAFALLQVPVTDRLTVRGGIRFEHFSLSVSDFTRPDAYYGVSPSLAYILPAIRVTGGQFTYSAPTYNVGATFKLTDTVDLYGGFSQGFSLPDVGAFTRRAGATAAYACPVSRPNCLPADTTVSFASIAPRAMLVNNYEVGIRGRIGRFRGGIAGFISTSENGVTFDSVTNQLSQQKEMIYGVEVTGEWTVTDALSLGGNFTWRDGRYDSNKDGRLDSALPNNRIANPFRGTLYGTYRFENGVAVRVEGVGFSGRNEPINIAGTIYPIKPGFTMNASVAAPVAGGQAFLAVNNLFDALYENPTATSVRNLTSYAWGRTVTAGFRRSF
jgi:iron complex outermembrane receptor protein